MTKKNTQGIGIIALFVLSSCLVSCQRQEVVSLHGALQKEGAGNFFAAHQDFKQLLPDFHGSELEPFILYSIAHCELRLKMLHEALEGFLSLSTKHTDSLYALWALEKAAGIYERDGNKKKANECYARALALYKNEKGMRRMANALAGARVKETKRLIEAQKNYQGKKLLERTIREVPEFLLEKDQKEMLDKVSKLQAERDYVNKAKTYQLAVEKVRPVRKISEQEFPGYKADSRYLVYSPDKRRYVCREMAEDGFYYLYLGEKGKPRRRLSKTRSALFPVWSKDGARLIFTRRDKKDGDYKIEVLSLADGVLRDLYVVGEELGYRVGCSHVSDKISFVYNGDIWLMEGNGLYVKKLTDGLRLPRATRLGWSADGSQIFYTSKPKKGDGSAVPKQGVVRLRKAG